MKESYLLLCLLFTMHLFAQKADSTDIKPGQRKGYTDRGFTNEATLKSSEKKMVFEARIEPVTFFDVKCSTRLPLYIATGQFVGVRQSESVSKYGGLNAGLGAVVNKKYHVHFVMGVEGGRVNQIYTLGGDFNVNLLPGKISPFVHVGVGYSAVLNTSIDVPSPVQYDNPPVRGFSIFGGVGLYVSVARFFAVNISPDYRFIYGAFKDFLGSGNNSTVFFSNIEFHQIGLRIAAVFN